MAYFSVPFLLSVFIATTAVTATSVHFRWKPDLPHEDKNVATDSDIGIRTELEKILMKKLEDFREKMKDPQPEHNLPVLDPFSGGDVDVSLNRTDQIEMKGKVSALLIEGLSGFELTRFKMYVAQSKGHIRMNLPQIKIESQYDLSGTISIIKIPMYGKGNATLTLHNVCLEARPRFAIVGKRLAISELNLNWNPAAWLEVSVDGLYCTSSEISAVLSRVFSDLTPRLLRNYKPILLHYADDILFRSINDLLTKLSLEDIIGMLPHNSITSLAH